MWRRQHSHGISRFLGFLACCAGGLACFFIAFLFLPIREVDIYHTLPSSVSRSEIADMNVEILRLQVALKPRKFALAFTLGSCLFMLGFAILHGPWNREYLVLLFNYLSLFIFNGLWVDVADRLVPDVKHILSQERLPFSIAYFGSLGLTLFFAIGVSLLIGFAR